MNPFFFGSTEERLLGVHHPPRGRAARETGVLLCAPFGQEAMRSHRAFRQLSLLLSRRGFHVLRFDWSGTGDSAGEGEEASLARWQRDAATAIQELKDTAEVGRVSLVGLRLGAAVAARAAAGRDDVGDLVLWDPVVRGDEHLEELRKAQLAHSGRDPGALDQQPPDAVQGLLGFPMSGTLAREVAAVDLTRADVSAARRVLAVVSEERESYAALGAALGERGALRCIATPGTWSEVDDFGSAWIPQQIVQAAVAFLDEEPPR